MSGTALRGTTWVRSSVPKALPDLLALRVLLALKAPREIPAQPELQELLAPLAPRAQLAQLEMLAPPDRPAQSELQVPQVQPA